MTLSILASLIVIFSVLTTVGSVVWLISKLNTTVLSLIDTSNEFKDTLMLITKEIREMHADIDRLKILEEVRHGDD